MKRQQKIALGVFASIGMVLLILDSKTALYGATAGIEICLKTVIPALFPFFLLTAVITKTLAFPLSKLLRPLGRLCKIPRGSESILMLGLLGGYPIGAQAVHSVYQSGILRKKAAHRMLTFCNNPGPAFIFGMVGCMFDSLLVPWIIWVIIILSAIVTSWLQPVYEDECVNRYINEKSDVLTVSIKSMAKVCSWVIIFRVMISILQRWVFWMLPSEPVIIITGLLELTNGCTSLLESNNEVFRFCSITALMSFGGVCVTMQTAGVSGCLFDRRYCIAKLFQLFLSVLLSYIAANLVFAQDFTKTGLAIASASLCLAVFTGYILYKNSTGNHPADDI